MQEAAWPPNKTEDRDGHLGQTMNRWRPSKVKEMWERIGTRARALREAFSVSIPSGQERYRVYTFKGWIE